MPTDQSHKTLFTLLFAQGFRIFFLLAALWSLIAMSLWLLILWGVVGPVDTPLLISWHHGHEMMFGFTTAAAAGFLLTATPVWSKTPPLTGRPLQIIAIAWILGRCGAIFSGYLPNWFATSADMIFFIGFLTFVGPTLWFTGNPVHRIFPILLILLGIGDLLFHLQAMNWTESTAHIGLLLGINAIIFFLVMTGGHIMPMFTKETLKNQGEEVAFKISPIQEIASALTLSLLIIADLFFTNRMEAGWIFIGAGIIQGIRLAQWHGLKTLRTPLLWVLHLGYLWLVMGLLLRGVARLTTLLDESAALHALSVGAMGLFTLGIMSRIALAHTGRPLQTPITLTWAFLLMAFAALFRVFLFAWDAQLATLLAGSLWIAAYSLFCMVFLKILITPRPDGQAG